MMGSCQHGNEQEILGFRRVVVKAFALLACDVVCVGSCLQKFRDSLSVRVQGSSTGSKR